MLKGQEQGVNSKWLDMLVLCAHFDESFSCQGGGQGSFMKIFCEQTIEFYGSQRIN
ncbi:hypothetical protein ABS784_12470 [Geobacillus sp. G4]|uniref:hypothetical protein n=1 Tax=Geobacillus TaxID=129337 RepID=UPI00135F1B10|nr:hypothetical protein [Geobacillus sp. MAS1]